MSLPQYRFHIRYVEPDADVDDEGRPIYTGHTVRLSVHDFDDDTAIDALEYSAEFPLDEMLDDLEHFDAQPRPVVMDFARAARMVLANAENFYREHGESCPTQWCYEMECICGFDQLRAALARYEKGDAK